MNRNGTKIKEIQRHLNTEQLTKLRPRKMESHPLIDYKIKYAELNIPIVRHSLFTLACSANTHTRKGELQQL